MNSEQKIVREVFQQLSEEHQLLLEFLSVLKETFSVYSLSGMPYFSGQKESLKSQLRELAELNWLQHIYYETYKLDHRVVDYLTLHSIERGRFNHYAEVVLEQMRDASSPEVSYTYLDDNDSQYLCDLRIHALRDDFDQVKRVIDQKFFILDKHSQDETAFQRIFGQIEQVPLLEHISDRMLLEWVAPQILKARALPLDVVHVFLPRYRRAIAAESELGERSMQSSAESLLWHSLIRGETDAPWCRCPFDDNDMRALPWKSHSAARLLVTGQLDEALKHFYEALELTRKYSRKRKGGIGNRFDVFFALGLLLKGDAASLQLVEELLWQKAATPIHSEPLKALLMYRKFGKLDAPDSQLRNVEHPTLVNRG